MPQKTSQDILQEIEALRSPAEAHEQGDHRRGLAWQARFADIFKEAPLRPVTLKEIFSGVPIESAATLEPAAIAKAHQASKIIANRITSHKIGVLELQGIHAAAGSAAHGAPTGKLRELAHNIEVMADGALKNLYPKYQKARQNREGALRILADEGFRQYLKETPAAGEILKHLCDGPCHTGPLSLLVGKTVTEADIKALWNDIDGFYRGSGSALPQLYGYANAPGFYRLQGSVCKIVREVFNLDGNKPSASSKAPRP